MLSIVTPVLLCVLLTTTCTSAYRCPEKTLPLTFQPNGIVFTCPTALSLKRHVVIIQAVCSSGTDDMIDSWVVCEDSYGQCVTMSCNTTKGLSLNSNKEDHRLVISSGKETRGIEMAVMTSSPHQLQGFLQQSSTINETLDNDKNTTGCSNNAICVSATIPDIIPSEWTTKQEFVIHSTELSGTIPSSLSTCTSLRQFDVSD
eukprot:PhF_6_TR18896/c0_g4_i2/m.27540